MTTIEEIRAYTRELSPEDARRAVRFNEVSRDEAILTYKMFFEQNRLPRKVFIEGYDAMYAAAALFLAKKHRVKLDDVRGGTHRNMRAVLDFYTHDSKHHARLLRLYEIAVERFNSLSQKYFNESHFARKVVKDLIDEGYHQGKKATYYSETPRKDPLSLTMADAKKFIKEIAEPFLFIMEDLTND
jgi:hypothetical protein